MPEGPTNSDRLRSGFGVKGEAQKQVVWVQLEQDPISRMSAEACRLVSFCCTAPTVLLARVNLRRIVSWLETMLNESFRHIFGSFRINGQALRYMIHAKHGHHKAKH